MVIPGVTCEQNAKPSLHFSARHNHQTHRGLFSWLLFPFQALHNGKYVTDDLWCDTWENVSGGRTRMLNEQ